MIKLNAVQKAMVKTMTEALQIPHLTFNEDIYMDNLIEIRNELKSKVGELKLTFMPFFIKALSITLHDFGIMNGQFDQDKVIVKSSHNVGFAMDTKLGLVVPNIKNCESKSIIDICREMNRLQSLGSEGKLTPEDITGTTITLSNVGNIGGMYARPIIAPPQVCIGALCAIRPRLEREQGEIVDRMAMGTSWSADHRVIDGATTARFVARLKQIIEEPMTLLINLK